ncbi:hypothetical protein DQ04_15451000 [Trypanosoma grayi]|uniref:hypothetical protein n=1 Tax=Trypanosoma grayi TaxID=71804 RepID=UPI0004F4410A|nr:hypothetical protein DQ04_15451000 [Trypanosoma grayi]KEG06180.1 hypothetical protein DQ04_15451000 [Trypanosoma grayi]
MLRHVLCVLALALCCCASSWAVETGKAEGPVVLELTNDNAKITLTETVVSNSCEVETTPKTGKSSDVTISTAVTWKKGESKETKAIPHESSKTVKVPAGYNLTLKTSLDVKCSNKGITAAAASEITCTVKTGEEATNSVTYDATVKSTTTGQTAVNNPETANLEVKVPVGHEANIFAKVVATCTPVPEATNSPKSEEAKDLTGEQLDTSSLNTNVGDMSVPLKPTSVKENTAQQKSDEQAPQGRTQSGTPRTPLKDPTTVSANQNDEVTSGEKGSVVSKDIPTPTSSEAESTETDNSVTVSDADHTASTAAPQSETTTEGAPNADAGTSTTAGEGAKLPDRNTDASSSSTAWVRAPLLSLLACVAVW